MPILSLNIIFLILIGVGVAQNDFSDPITCYICNGTASNSTCADPIDVDDPSVTQKECDRGICLKWTKYKGRVLQMIRTCSSDLNFHLTMIHDVCRTERNGNGKLCMCGKHLCNGATSNTHAEIVRVIVFLGISILTMAWSKSQ
ncbi:protein quiver [Plakobranchus ocellatus]|uniref:Protein quiver n=1 Tax=Plakobranchus ocellatus TaxID=259542 RepID=A0AAV3YY36_9GAST|nr:protein quiver [Plakobranchus ocellatus]